MAAERPNVLWLVSEDNNPFIGAYGEMTARTPIIDQLAREGTLFRNVYCPAPVCAPTRFAILTGAYAQTCSPAHHMRAIAALPPVLRTYPEYLRSAGYYCSNNSKTDYNCDIDPARIWDDSSEHGHWKNRPADKPFFSVFNFMSTHESRLFTAQDDPEAFSGIRIPAYLPDTPEVRKDYANYYALMNKMDGEVGEKLAELRAAGLADDTIVFYYSDNGGVLPRSKRYCYDEGLRVALVTYFPPKWRHLSPFAPGTVVEAPVNLVDLAPTLLSLIDIPRPQQMQGRAFLGRYAEPPAEFAFGARNRMDERYDFVRTVTDGRFRYIRNYMPHRIWGMRGDFEWQLKSYQSWDAERLAGRLDANQMRFFETKPFEELYDLASDPDQLTNLVGQPAQKRRLAVFRKALDDHMLAIRDQGFIPEGAPAEGYANGRNDGVYPLRRILALAQAAARGDKRKAGLFRRALEHPNGVMRYWAATGLLILGEGAARDTARLLEVARSDLWPSVRVVAAEALCRTGAPERGLDILAELLREEQTVAPRLMAINALDSLDELARAVMPTLKLACDDPDEYVVRAARPLVARLEGTYSPEKSYGRGTTARS
jgi:arylsulfatase A-like enzyme